MNSWKKRTYLASAMLAASATAIGMVAPVQAASTTTVTWLVRTDPVVNPWEKATVQAFEKLHPDIHVQLIISAGGASYDQKLLTLNAAGTPPDIFSHWGNDSVADFINRGLATNLTPYIKKSGFSLAGMPPALIKQYSSGNSIYGIPFATGGSYVFYNVDLFKKAHLHMLTTNWNDRRWNWNTLLKDAKKLTKQTGQLANSQFGLVADLWPENAYAWLFGGDIFPASAYRTGVVTKVTATSPAVEAAVRWQRDIVSKYKVSPTPDQTTGLSAQMNAFLTGKVGMYMTGPWGFWVFKPAKFHWAAAPLPYFKTDKDVFFTDPWILAKGSKHPDAAWTFLEYLASPKYGAKSYALVTGVLPPWRQLIPAWAKAQAKHVSLTEKQLIQLGNGGMSHGEESINHLAIGYGQFDSVITNVLNPVWTGSTDPKTALAQLQKQLTQTISQVKINKKR